MVAFNTCLVICVFSSQPMVVPNAPLHVPISATSTQVVSDILSKMLMVGITDPGTVSLPMISAKCSKVNQSKTALLLVYIWECDQLNYLK